MRIVFLGTPEFAVPTLEACASAGHEIAAVYTQPDRPKGRGQEVGVSAVKDAALRLGLPVRQPQKVRDAAVVEELRALHADAMVIVGYGQIVPQSILDLPPLGIVNVHASLLPKYRGAAPIQWAIASGETRTGVTTMKIDAGLDTGDIIEIAETEIVPGETSIELSPRLAAMGARLLVSTLSGIEAGRIRPIPQDHSQATLAPILRKENGLVEWSRPANEIVNRCRGFQPWPGCFTSFRDKTFTIFRAQVSDEPLVGEPGSVRSIRKRMIVACGHSTSVELLEVQLEGRRRATASDFLNGQRLGDNEALGVRQV